MFPREIFWANFRLMRPRVKGMAPDRRRALFHTMRGGPILIGLSVAASIMGAGVK